MLEHPEIAGLSPIPRTRKQPSKSKLFQTKKLSVRRSKLPEMGEYSNHEGVVGCAGVMKTLASSTPGDGPLQKFITSLVPLAPATARTNNEAQVGSVVVIVNVSASTVE